VLGIAAAIKGAGRVICVDNDPQALTATRDNAQRNGVQDDIECLAPEQFSPQTADVVLANILAGPLIELAPRLCATLGTGSSLALSGILEGQAPEVLEAYAGKVPGLEKRVMDGWVLLTGTR
jgi:ribosomal protein L11 methyltransferase